VGTTKVYGYEMARISEVYLSTLSAIMKPHGIERYFFPLVHLCENNGKLTQKELGLAIRKDKVSIMRMVDYLCDKEFLARKQDCNDRRCQILEVTDKALEILPKLKEGINQANEILLNEFSEEEKNQFKQSMDKLFKTICDLPEPEFIVKAFKRNNE
jgi:DNA-binding MarR family transcriptional regulator